MSEVWSKGQDQMKGGPMSEQDEMKQLLHDIGCRCRHPNSSQEWYILDGISIDFYLLFDTSLDDEEPKPGTCDVFLLETGDVPGSHDCRIAADLIPKQIIALLRLMNLPLLKERVRDVLEVRAAIYGLV